MKTPDIPANELERLEDLHKYDILDTLTEREYDDLTRIASDICETPIALVSIVDEDRQWFKSAYGLDAKETPRDCAFCAHAINTPENIFEIEDSRKDERFHDNPLVTGDPNVVFYAGVPLVSENGFPLGTLCLIDNKPKKLDENQKASLTALSNQAMKLMELRKKTNSLKKANKNLEEKAEQLERFASTAAHDLKSPLNNITGLVSLFSDSYLDDLDPEGVEILDKVSGSVKKLGQLIEGLLNFSKDHKLLEEDKTSILVKNLEEDISVLCGKDDTTSISFDTAQEKIECNRSAIMQIMINLVSNAVKYNDKDVAEVIIDISENETHYLFSVSDNGPGIPSEKHEEIFKLFTTFEDEDRFGDKGNGIGLATVQKLITALDGQIEVNSEAGKGTEFSFSIKK